MTVHMRDATHDSIDFPILSAGHSVAFKGMKKGMGFDSVITIQNFPSAVNIAAVFQGLLYSVNMTVAQIQTVCGAGSG
ncbi:hypothetical protein BHE74_00018401 [Ensete ventricosum]|nr:hypothetical protein BHE74_00018401 [Ensete ventricosum]